MINHLTKAFVALVMGMAFYLSMPLYAHEGHGDLDAVEQVYENYRRIWLRNDDNVEQDVIALFTADATLIPGGGEMLTGRDDIGDFLFENIDTVINFQHSIQKSEANGNLGYVIGSFLLTYMLEGEETTIQGTDMMVMRKVDEQWKIITMVWSGAGVQ